METKGPELGSIRTLLGSVTIICDTVLQEKLRLEIWLTQHSGEQYCDKYEVLNFCINYVLQILLLVICPKEIIVDMDMYKVCTFLEENINSFYFNIMLHLLFSS